MSKKECGDKILSQNRKAFFEYEIGDKFEAGISLLGPEVKSARLGGANISDAHIGFDKDGMILFNMHVSPYKYIALGMQLDPIRNRRLLMHGREIIKISSKIKKNGMTIVPLKLYINKRQKIKVEIGVATGKKAHDKRRAIKERDLDREMRREVADKM